MMCPYNVLLLYSLINVVFLSITIEFIVGFSADLNKSEKMHKTRTLKCLFVQIELILGKKNSKEQLA